VPYLIREFPRISSAKAYAFSAGPRDTCIGKGKARAPYEFGCKSLPLRKQKCRWQPRPPSPKGGQFVLHAKALHGNPFDGHTLGPVIAELEALTGIETRRIDVDKSLPLRRRGLSRP